MGFQHGWIGAAMFFNWDELKKMMVVIQEACGRAVGQRNGHGFAEGRSRFASEAITFFFLVALRHKKEGKKLFLPSLSVNRNLAVQLIPTFVALQTAAGFCQRRLDDRNVDEFFVAWLIICFDRA